MSEYQPDKDVDPMRIAWCTSTAPCSKIVTERLLPHLIAGGHRITVFSEVPSKFSAKFSAKFPAKFSAEFLLDSSKHYLSLASEHKKAPYDFILYHLEDSLKGEWVRILLGTLPGICFAHNLVFRNPPPVALAHSPWVPLSTYLFGLKDENEQVIEEAISRPKEIQIPHPFAKREIALALDLITYNGWILEEYRSHLKQVDSFQESRKGRGNFLPFPTENKGEDRALLENKFSVVFLGAPEIESHYVQFLEAVSLNEVSDINYLWACKAEEEKRVKDILSQESRPQVASVKVVVCNDIREWSVLSRDVSIALHLNHSVFNSITPFIAESSKNGAIPIVVRFGESNYFPENSCYQLSPGFTEAQELSIAIKKFHEAFIQGHTMCHGDSEIFMNSEKSVRELVHCFPHWKNLSALAFKRYSILKERAVDSMNEGQDSKRYRS